MWSKTARFLFKTLLLSPTPLPSNPPSFLTSFAPLFLSPLSPTFLIQLFFRKFPLILSLPSLSHPSFLARPKPLITDLIQWTTLVKERQILRDWLTGWGREQNSRGWKRRGRREDGRGKGGEDAVRLGREYPSPRVTGTDLQSSHYDIEGWKEWEKASWIESSLSRNVFQGTHGNNKARRKICDPNILHLLLYVILLDFKRQGEKRGKREK